MKHDRFLIFILIFIVLLVGTAIGTYFIRQGKQGYLSETSPENVAKNYVLALQNKEFEKAYSYLKKEENSPSISTFQETFLKQQHAFNDVSFRIVSVNEHEQQAVLEIIIIHGGGEPFSRTWQEYNSIFLEKEGDNWKITSFPAPYWGWNWQLKPDPVD